MERRITKNEVIQKYGLVKAERDCMGIPLPFEQWTSEETKNGVKTVRTLQQDELCPEVYYLITQKFYLNQPYTNRYGEIRVKTRQTVQEVYGKAGAAV